MNWVLAIFWRIFVVVAILFLFFGLYAVFAPPNEDSTSSYYNTGPERKEECVDALEYVNELRQEKGLNALIWNESLYELATYRARDLYEREYFDHTTPEGTCVKDFKNQAGFEDYIIAENLGAQLISENYGAYVYDTEINPTEQVDGWMESRGHRYNLLYADHIYGAIGCYGGVCVFLGAHQDPWGLGAGPCTTGEEGLAYWESVPLQPGEQ